jgi:hypothetical protein
MLPKLVPGAFQKHTTERMRNCSNASANDSILDFVRVRNLPKSTPEGYLGLALAMASPRPQKVQYSTHTQHHLDLFCSTSSMTSKRVSQNDQTSVPNPPKMTPKSINILPTLRPSKNTNILTKKCPKRIPQALISLDLCWKGCRKSIGRASSKKY